MHCACVSFPKPGQRVRTPHPHDVAQQALEGIYGGDAPPEVGDDSEPVLQGLVWYDDGSWKTWPRDAIETEW